MIEHHAVSLSNSTGPIIYLPNNQIEIGRSRSSATNFGLPWSAVVRHSTTGKISEAIDLSEGDLILIREWIEFELTHQKKERAAEHAAKLTFGTRVYSTFPREWEGKAGVIVGVRENNGPATHRVHVEGCDVSGFYDPLYLRLTPPETP